MADILKLLEERLGSDPLLVAGAFQILRKESLFRVEGTDNLLHLSVARALPGIKTVDGRIALQAAEIELRARGPAAGDDALSAAVQSAVSTLTGRYEIQGVNVAGAPSAAYPVSRGVDRDDRVVFTARQTVNWAGN